MTKKLNIMIPKEELKPWDEKNAKPGSIVAYQDGKIFRYAQLHGKEGKDDMYSVIITRYKKENKVITTYGKVVPQDVLRLVRSKSMNFLKTQQSD